MGQGTLKPGRLRRSFFARPPESVAPDLLGCVLERPCPEGSVAVRLVEVEAYAGGEDPASHAWRGRTARNAAMYGPPGTLYVYFVYGMHWCVNVVCEAPGTPAAVLLRAGEVVDGVEQAHARRGPAVRPRDLARGPARLAQALGIDRSLDGRDLLSGQGIRLRLGEPVPADRVAAGPRVGVRNAADRPWRYWIAGDPNVSGYRRGATGPVAQT